MYKEQSRERRIRDKQRMKAKAIASYKSNGYSDPFRAVKHADYMAVCSCDMCGNPRRHFGKRTLQERRVIESMEDDMLYHDPVTV